MVPEAIYKGATRPAMRMGIPLVPLVALLGVGALLIMWIGPFITWWIAPAVLGVLALVLGWMRFTTRRDDQRLRQQFLALRLRLRDRNHAFWRSRSYSPYGYRRTHHVWHR